MSATDVCALVDTCTAKLAKATNRGAVASPAFPMACFFMGFRDNECQNEVLTTLNACWDIDWKYLPVFGPSAPYAKTDVERLIWDEIGGDHRFHPKATNRAILAYFVDLACTDEDYDTIAQHFDELPRPLGVECQYLVFTFAHTGGVAEDWNRCGRHFKQLAKKRGPLTLACFADVTNVGPLSLATTHENYRAAADLLYVANSDNGGNDLRYALNTGGLLCVSYKTSGANCRQTVVSSLAKCVKNWKPGDTDTARALDFDGAGKELDKDDGWTGYLFEELWDKRFTDHLKDRSTTFFTVPYTDEIAGLDACFSKKRGFFGFSHVADFDKIGRCADKAVASLCGSDGTKGVWELMLERYYLDATNIMFKCEKQDAGGGSVIADGLESVLRQRFTLNEMTQLLPEDDEESRRCFEELYDALMQKARSRYDERLSTCVDLGMCLDTRARYDMECGYVSRMLAKTLGETLTRVSGQAASLIQELDVVSDELNRMGAQGTDVAVPSMPQGISSHNLQDCLEDAFDTIKLQIVEGLTQGHQDELQVARGLLNAWGCIGDIRIPLNRIPEIDDDMMCPNTACVLRAQKPDDDRVTVISPWSNRVEYLAVLPLDVDDIQGW